MKHASKTALAVATAAALGLLSQPARAVNLTFETAAAGGAPYLSATHLAEVTASAKIADLQVQAGQTLTNSVLNVAEGKSDIAAAPLMLPFLLKLGAGPYGKMKDKGAALTANLRALWPYNFGSYALVSFSNSGITRWDQVKGKTVYNGPPRGAALNGARQLMQLVTGYVEGKDYKGLQVNWGQAMKTVVDGSADVNLLPNTVPSERVTAAVSAGHVNMISIPKAIFESEAFQRFANSPGYAPVEIKLADLGYRAGVTLVSEDGIFRSINTTGAEVVNKSMSNDMAKALTAAYIKSIDQLKAKTPYARNLGIGELDAKKSGFCGANPLKYHPGAVAAWEEAGYKVPDCAKP